MRTRSRRRRDRRVPDSRLRRSPRTAPRRRAVRRRPRARARRRSRRARAGSRFASGRARRTERRRASRAARSRPLGVRLGEGHRHIEVRATCAESSGEDLRVEARVSRVQDERRARRGSTDESSLVRGIDADGAEARVAKLLDERPRPLGIEVAERDLLEEVSPCCERRERAADATGTDDEDPHGADDTALAYRLSLGRGIFVSGDTDVPLTGEVPLSATGQGAPVSGNCGKWVTNAARSWFDSVYARLSQSRTARGCADALHGDGERGERTDGDGVGPPADLLAQAQATPAATFSRDRAGHAGHRQRCGRSRGLLSRRRSRTRASRRACAGSSHRSAARRRSSPEAASTSPRERQAAGHRGDHPRCARPARGGISNRQQWPFVSGVARGWPTITNGRSRSCRRSRSSTRASTRPAGLRRPRDQAGQPDVAARQLGRRRARPRHVRRRHRRRRGAGLHRRSAEREARLDRRDRRPGHRRGRAT